MAKFIINNILDVDLVLQDEFSGGCVVAGEAGGSVEHERAAVKPTTTAKPFNHFTKAEYRALYQEILLPLTAGWHPVCGDPDADMVLLSEVSKRIAVTRADQSLTKGEARRIIGQDLTIYGQRYKTASETHLNVLRAKFRRLPNCTQIEIRKIITEYEQVRGWHPDLARIEAWETAKARGWITADGNRTAAGAALQRGVWAAKGVGKLNKTLPKKRV